MQNLDSKTPARYTEYSKYLLRNHRAEISPSLPAGTAIDDLLTTGRRLNQQSSLDSGNTTGGYCFYTVALITGRGDNIAVTDFPGDNNER